MNLTKEQIDNRIANYEKLKIPYDSGEMYHKEIANTIGYDVLVKFELDDWRNLLTLKADVGSILAYGNTVVNDFYIKPDIETFNYVINIPSLNHTIKGTTQKDINFSNLLLEITKNLQSIPVQFRCKVSITRNNNFEERKHFYFEHRGGKTPQEVFNKICGCEVNGDYSNHRRWSNPFKGYIKQTIYKQYKETAIFCIEYLYGKKMPTNSTFKQIYKVLSSLPYDSFGILDVQHILKFQEKFRYLGGIPSVFDILYFEIQVKPKTDLKRWIKKGTIKNAPEKIETRKN